MSEVLTWSSEESDDVKFENFGDCISLKQTDTTYQSIPPGDFEAIVFLEKDQALKLLEELKKWLKV